MTISEIEFKERLKNDLIEIIERYIYLDNPEDTRDDIVNRIIREVRDYYEI